MQWKVIDSGAGSAQDNMSLDGQLLEGLEGSENPILHLYDWKGPSATHGLLMSPEDFLSIEGLEKEGVELAERPTGGGIIFHLWDFAFSVLVPSRCPLFSTNTLDNYALVNRAVLEMVKEFLGEKHSFELIAEDEKPQDLYCERFCMAKPTKYDVVYEGKKIAGAAQRKTKKGFLHQGSIALCMPDEKLLEKVLYPQSAVLEAMLRYTHPLLGSHPVSSSELEEARFWFKERLVHFLKRNIS